MPTVKGYTPPWLASSPAVDLFRPAVENPRSALVFSENHRPTRARRTIARRGTEVYVAVGREIRWLDLVYVKDLWQSSNSRRGRALKREDSEGSLDFIEDDEFRSSAGASSFTSPPGYRIIKTPVADDIESIIISPEQNYLAVCTAHNIYICVLPDSGHLTAPNYTDVLKPKFCMLGPTIHVTSRPALASALWHPLGVKGSCIVTVTTDATVRLWEINFSDRLSFDSPTLAIDLKKLADGTSLDDDFSASVAAKTAGFSPDSFEMQPAAASFPPRGSGGWSSMTLWVAMTEGDVYALCPLLPSKWAPPPTLIPSLSVSIVSNLAAIEDDPEVSPEAKQLAQQQLDWMADIDSQDPHLGESLPGEPPVEIYKRPSRPGSIPKLQGPFEIEFGPDSDDDLDANLTDIFVIGQKLETDDLMMGEEDDLEMDAIDRDGLSLSVVCLLSRSGQVRVCLDMDGVEAKWLPPRKKSKAARLLAVEEWDEPSLVTFQTLNVLYPREILEDSWPTFSPDVTSRYCFFVTHPSSITHVSLSSWVSRLESELQGESSAGVDFRLDLLARGQNTTRERLYARDVSEASDSLAGAVAIRDADLGYFLLSASSYDPIAVLLEDPDDEAMQLTPETSVCQDTADRKPLELFSPRPPFTLSYAFDEPSKLPASLDKLRGSRHRMLVNQEVRLSPATLEIFAEVHQLLADETNRLSKAAAELFNKCKSLQRELQEQIKAASDVRARSEGIVNAQGDNGEEPITANEKILERIHNAQARQKQLTERLESLKKKISKAGTRPLSDKERAFVHEVETMHAGVVGSGTTDTATAKPIKTPRKRFEDVEALRNDLLSQAAEVATHPGDDSPGPSVPSLRIPNELRKAKVAEVKALLRRESELVDGVKARLEKLTVG